MNLQNSQPSLARRAIDRNMAIEASRSQQGGVEHIGTIRGSQNDDGLVLLEAVHFAQDLVEGLLALIVAAADSRSTDAPHSVNLVNEENAGGVLLGGAEHVAHTARPDPDEHLDKFRSVDRVERDARL